MADSGGIPGYPRGLGGALEGRYEAGSDGDQPAHCESALNDGVGRRESGLPVCSCGRLPLVVFERDRRLVAQRRVTPAPVVEALDELEDRHARLGVAAKAAPIQQLALQGREEALAQRVVVGIAHRAGRGSHASLLAARPERDRGVL